MLAQVSLQTETYLIENLPLDREGNRESYDFREAVVSSTNIDESLFIDVTTYNTNPQ